MLHSWLEASAQRLSTTSRRAQLTFRASSHRASNSQITISIHLALVVSNISDGPTSKRPETTSFSTMAQSTFLRSIKEDMETATSSLRWQRSPSGQVTSLICSSQVLMKTAQESTVSNSTLEASHGYSPLTTNLVFKNTTEIDT